MNVCVTVISMIVVIFGMNFMASFESTPSEQLIEQASNYLYTYIYELL